MFQSGRSHRGPTQPQLNQDFVALGNYKYWYLSVDEMLA